ncbi:hypothetical protein CL628_01125 [bacterium]|nr:hypothetical protein [bacterium]
MAVIVTVIVICASVFHQDSGQGALQAWNLYSGAIPGYDVEIDEADRGQTFRRIVHLYPIDASGERTGPSWVSITGHDYNDDGNWDRVFYCGMRDTKYGCNSVIMTRDGRWTWSPCPADEGKVEPFTMGEIKFAILRLNEAMSGVHNAKHRTSTLEEWRKRHDKQFSQA